MRYNFEGYEKTGWNNKNIEDSQENGIYNKALGKTIDLGRVTESERATDSEKDP